MEGRRAAGGGGREEEEGEERTATVTPRTVGVSLPKSSTKLSISVIAPMLPVSTAGRSEVSSH